MPMTAGFDENEQIQQDLSLINSVLNATDLAPHELPPGTFNPVFVQFNFHLMAVHPSSRSLQGATSSCEMMQVVTLIPVGDAATAGLLYQLVRLARLCNETDHGQQRGCTMSCSVLPSQAVVLPGPSPPPILFSSPASPQSAPATTDLDPVLSPIDLTFGQSTSDASSTWTHTIPIIIITTSLVLCCLLLMCVLFRRRKQKSSPVDVEPVVKAPAQRETPLPVRTVPPVPVPVVPVPIPVQTGLGVIDLRFNPSRYSYAYPFGQPAEPFSRWHQTYGLSDEPKAVFQWNVQPGEVHDETPNIYDTAPARLPCPEKQHFRMLHPPT